MLAGCTACRFPWLGCTGALASLGCTGALASGVGIAKSRLDRHFQAQRPRHLRMSENIGFPSPSAELRIEQFMDPQLIDRIYESSLSQLASSAKTLQYRPKKA